MLSDAKTLADATWDVWFYRTNIGWWLEEEGCEGVDEVNRVIFAFMFSHQTESPHEFSLMVLPTCKQPSNFRPM